VNKATKVVLALALAIIVGAMGFIVGFAVAHSVTAPELAALHPANAAASGLASTVNHVQQLLDDNALNPPSESSATAGAVQGLLSSNGDKYAMYFDAKQLKAFNQETAGSFGGIGVSLGEKNGAAYVIDVYPGTPAAKAGIKAGDTFVSINGVTKPKWSSNDVVQKVRGDIGTTVTVGVNRPPATGTGPGTNLTFTLTRENIVYPNIKSEKIGNVGYIRLGEFNAKAADDVSKAVQDLTKQGAKSFVLDLRDNPGGLLDEAVGVSSLFIHDGVIVRIDERNKPEQVLEANGTKLTDAPLVVLVDSNSASASEITAGALQDYGRAILVGEKSYGKGSVQTIEDLGDGSAVKFTTAHYLTPKKRAINGIGLTPDVVVTMDPLKQQNRATDTQLQRALEIAAQKAAGK